MAVLLLLSYLSVYISPQVNWQLAFFGLAFPFFLLANLACVLIWIIWRKWYLILSLAIILIGWNYTGSYFSFNFNQGGLKKPGLKVLTYNVRNFDLYNWEHNEKSRQDIHNYLKEISPHILCLQEFYTQDGSDFENVESLKKSLNLPYQFSHYTLIHKGGNKFGQIIFSSYPIISEGVVKFPKRSNNTCTYVDIQVQSDTIRVFNVHLQSIHLGNDGENVVEKILNEQEADIKSSRQVIGKLKRGYIKRAPQADAVAKAIQKSPYKVIICGDFNDTPVSYTYYQISKGLKDVFTNKGLGVGATFAGKIPWLRIDYILSDPSFRVKSYHLSKVYMSDHFPIVAIFEIP